MDGTKRLAPSSGRPARGWAEDPELLETFRAEVQDRLSSLTAGLLRLEGSSSPRQLLASLFRDAHSVKGAARLLGMEEVVAAAHGCEDLLGAFREGRLAVTAPSMDLLLVAVDAIGRCLPGPSRLLSGGELAPVLAALDAVAAGREVALPMLPAPDQPDLSTAGHADGMAAASVRVPGRRVHELLELVDAAERDVRRIAREGVQLAELAADLRRMAGELRTTLDDCAEAVRLDPPAVERLKPPADDLRHRADELSGRADMLMTHADALASRTDDAQARLEAVRDGSLALALVPLGRLVPGLRALVRELSGRIGTRVVLDTDGETVEIDARIFDAVTDALRHLVTNAVDHGCEPMADRLFVGKPATATISVSARTTEAGIVIVVSDDGRGLDELALRQAAMSRGLLPTGSPLSGPALWRLVFEPGLSTRSAVNDSSGRGVGLDAARSAVEALGGAVAIESERGRGTRFTVTLPVSLSVRRLVVVRSGGQRFAVPAADVALPVDLPAPGSNGGLALRMPWAVPSLLGAVDSTAEQRPGRVPAAVVGCAAAGTNRLGWGVDSVEAERELVVKDLAPMLDRPPFVIGTARDRDGTAVPVLDLAALARHQTRGSTGVRHPLPAAADQLPLHDRLLARR